MSRHTAILITLFLSFFTFPGLKRGAENSRVSDAFAAVLEGRVAGKSTLNVQIVPEATTLHSRELLLVNGKTQVLSIPTAIENHSETTIVTTIAHEWYGGLWPPTDLYVVVKKRTEQDKVWLSSPGYLVGELGSTGSFTRVEQGGRRSLDIRLNWPGTGSCPTQPLIRDSEPGPYLIKFLLFFKAKNELRQFIETPEIEIEVCADDSAHSHS